MIKKLNNILTARDKKFFFLLVLFSIVISAIEVIGISAIMPFMSIVMDMKIIHSNQYLTYFYELLNFTNDTNFVIVFGLILIGFYIFRSLMNIFYTYLMAKFSQGRYYLIVYRLFENYMGLPYKDFITKNPSYLTKSIISESNILAALMAASLLMLSELFVVVFIYIMLLIINFKLTLLLTCFLLLNAILMVKTISKKIKNHGTIRAMMQKSFYAIINKSFANFKLIKIQSNDHIVLNEFSKASHGYTQANIIAHTLLQVPKLLLEALAFSLVISIILYLVWKYQNDLTTVLSILSMFILALYRLMPSINRIMNSYNQILFSHKALDIIHNDLMYASELLGDNNIEFTKDIYINNINFEYEEKKPILKNITISIQKGEKVAFIGESGSGKSTLIDMLIGLYKPSSGVIKIDGVPLSDKNIKSWRKKIGYIPQSVYLFDGTIAENIAYGSIFNEQNMIRCLKQAKIYDFIQTKNGLNTLVGENGIMLSGGQKQRIAIARALYTNPEVLVLDEATSALDSETEKQIMDELYELCHNKTLIIIAHRLSTIEQCKKIYKIENGEIVNV